MDFLGLNIRTRLKLEQVRVYQIRINHKNGNRHERQQDSTLDNGYPVVFFKGSFEELVLGLFGTR